VDIKTAAAAMGKKGGRAGTGASKRRNPAHYKKMSAAGVKARREKKKNENKN
jgi:hypothetical protein